MKLLAIALLFTSVAALPTRQDEPTDVSIIQLIANPNQFDGKLVRVIGFLRLEFEGDALYLHSEDYIHSITENSIWVKISDEMKKNKDSLDLRYVIIEGVYREPPKGGYHQFSGTIEQIRRADAWRFDRDYTAHHPN